MKPSRVLCSRHRSTNLSQASRSGFALGSCSKAVPVRRRPQQVPTRSTALLLYSTLLLPLWLGCVSYYHHHAVAQSERIDLAEGTISREKIGVRRPTLSNAADDPIAQWDPEAAVRIRTHESDRLIMVLSESEQFLEVAYVDEMRDAPTIEIRPAQGPPHEGVDGQNFMVTGLFLGFVPVVERWESGVYFTLSKRNLPAFRCDWPVTKVTGWIAYPLRLSKKWKPEYDREAFQYNLRRCLLDQRDLFEKPDP